MLDLRYEGNPEGLMEYIAEQVNCWDCMDTGEVTSGDGPDRETHACHCRVDDSDEDDDSGDE